MDWLAVTLWMLLFGTVSGFALRARAARAYVPVKVRSTRNPRTVQYLRRRIR